MFNIKTRTLGVLEQACQHYALKAYEVFWDDIAIGLKSIKFSYKEWDKPGYGMFTATFTPFKDKLGNAIITNITFDVLAKDPYDEKYRCWELSKANLNVNEGFYTGSHRIRFVGTSRDDIAIKVRMSNSKLEAIYAYHVGTGHTPRVCKVSDLEEWRLQDWKLIQVQLP